MEKWPEYLDQAKKHFKTADHMSYVTLTLLKENRLLIKIVVELSEATLNLIKAFLAYEYSLKRVRLYRDPLMNLKTFQTKIAPKYLEKQDIVNLVKILEINKKHKQAPVEFVKKEKFVILLGEEYETITLEKVKEFLTTIRKVLANFPETT
jgi:hypothetical protein